MSMVYCGPMFSKPLTKRQLGLLLVVGGLLGFVAIIAVDLIDIGREGGIGPAQQIALGLMILVALAGLTLLPLKDSPA
jgi:hypothetical protein